MRSIGLLFAVLAYACSDTGPAASGQDSGADDAATLPSRDASTTPADADAGTAAALDAATALPDAATSGPDAAILVPDAAVAPPDASMPPDAGALEYCSQDPVSSKVSLPADDSAHSEPMEWWYWTGHLKTASGRWFGFEEVFFGTLTMGIPGKMVHVAITDIDNNQFHHYTSILPGSQGSVPSGFDMSMGPQTAVGGNGHDTLHGEADGWTLDLKLDAAKPPVMQHGDGYTDYSFGGYTYYYSRERMDAAGTLSSGGTTYDVAGNGWFDHQYGDIVTAVNLGWDWFAFQLDDNREIMLFVVRKAGSQVLVGGSYTDQYCVTSQIAADEFQVTALGQWKSPHTGCTYPSGWTVVVKGMTFTVTPTILDQEVSTAVPIYWEGASLVSGDATGRAYVELDGYCP